MLAYKNLFCLGKYDLRKWSCIARLTFNTGSKLMEYEVKNDGIYAIIFSPDISDECFRNEVRKEVYCGILCNDKRLVFIFTLLILPVVIILVYILYKM